MTVQRGKIDAESVNKIADDLNTTTITVLFTAINILHYR